MVDDSGEREVTRVLHEREHNQAAVPGTYTITVVQQRLVPFGGHRETPSLEPRHGESKKSLEAQETEVEPSSISSGCRFCGNHMEEVFQEESDLRKGGRVEEKTIIELHTHPQVVHNEVGEDNEPQVANGPS